MKKWNGNEWKMTSMVKAENGRVEGKAEKNTGRMARNDSIGYNKDLSLFNEQ